MAKKKKPQIDAETMQQMVATAEVITEEYGKKLDADPEMSLIVDADNHYNLSDMQKAFILTYVDNKNLALSATMCGITLEEAAQYLGCTGVQVEISRINRAKYHRQFQKGMMTLDQMGSYLSALIQDDDILSVDRLTPSQKMEAMRLIMSIQDRKLAGVIDPNAFNANTKGLEKTVKNMSVSAIKAMLAQIDKPVEDKDKKKVINEINSSNYLTEEDVAVLEGLSMEQLLEIVNKLSLKKKNETIDKDSLLSRNKN